MSKSKYGGNRNEVKMLPYFVSAHCMTQVIADKAFEVPEKIPSVSLMTYGKVFRNPLRKPGRKTPKACGHAGMDKFMHKQTLVGLGLKS